MRKNKSTLIVHRHLSKRKISDHHKHAHHTFKRLIYQCESSDSIKAISETDETLIEWHKASTIWDSVQNFQDFISKIRQHDRHWVRKSRARLECVGNKFDGARCTYQTLVVEEEQTNMSILGKDSKDDDDYAMTIICAPLDRLQYKRGIRASV